MTVETVYGEFVLAKGQAVPPRTASFHHYKQTLKTAMDRAILPAGSEVGSTVHMADIPADAVLSQLGVFTYDAMGADTTIAIGLANDSEISLASKTALLNAATAVATAGSIAIGAAVTRDKWFTPLWKLAGLTTKPTKLLHIVATLGGATSSAGGDVAWEFPYVSY